MQIDEKQVSEIIQKVLDQVMGKGEAKGMIQAASITTPAVEVPVVETPSTSSASQEAPAHKISTSPGMMTRKLVALGADHGGYELKEELKTTLKDMGFEVQDVGTSSKEAVDYPDYAHEVAKLVSFGTAWRGIMIDGAGIGSCIVANKVPGIRAGMAYDLSSAINSREHNDTNVLTLGAGLIGTNLAKQIIKTWLITDFGGERHQRRIKKITLVEQQYRK